jgi:muramoyltetrapeptide carboxypeptidase
MKGQAIPRILPPRIYPGATLAVYSPSFPGPALYPRRLEQGVASLRRQGFDVVIPDAARQQNGYKSGSSQQRAEELGRLFSDPAIDGIITSIGGFNSNEILPWLDFESIANHPKVFVGYSDTTALLLALYAKTGLVTFHGPAVMPEWGEFPAPQQYTVEWFRRIIMQGEAVDYQPPEGWTDEYLEWEHSEDQYTHRKLYPHKGWRSLIEGKGRGKLVGGNIETINSLIGTPYCPSFDNAIVFLEATREEAYLPRLDRALTHLELAGAFSSAAGLLMARCPDAKSERGVDLYTLLCRIGERWGLPIAADLDFGHTDPKITLPIGVEAEIFCDTEGIKLRITEPAVSG